MLNMPFIKVCFYLLFQVIPHRPEKYKGQFDFGTMGMSENRCMTFTLRNDNPVDVSIYLFVYFSFDLYMQ